MVKFNLLTSILFVLGISLCKPLEASSIRLLLENATEEGVVAVSNEVLTYSSISTDEFVELNPGEKKYVEIDIITSAFSDGKEKEPDGLYFEINGHQVPILWGLRKTIPGDYSVVVEPFEVHLNKKIPYEIQRELTRGGIYHYIFQDR